jgi:hypothetical protein
MIIKTIAIFMLYITLSSCANLHKNKQFEKCRLVLDLSEIKNHDDKKTSKFFILGFDRGNSGVTAKELSAVTDLIAISGTGDSCSRYVNSFTMSKEKFLTGLKVKN